MDKLSRELWDFHYQKSGMLNIPDENVVRFFIDQKKKIDKNPTVLDYGCGCGRNGSALLSLGFRVDFFDESSQALEQLRKRLSNRQVRIFDKSSQIKESYDYILLWGVLHYNNQQSRREILQFCHRHLHKGGIVLASLRSHRERNLTVVNDRIIGGPLQGAYCHLFRKSEIHREFCLFDVMKIGLIERTLPFRMERRISHYVVVAKKS